MLIHQGIRLFQDHLKQHSTQEIQAESQKRRSVYMDQALAKKQQRESSSLSTTTTFSMIELHHK